MRVIIAEKPKVARKIAEALGLKKIEKIGNVYVYHLEDGSVVVPAVGHIYSLYPRQKGWFYPIFDVEWRPKSTSKGFEYVKDYLNALKKFLSKADEVVIATDYDVEGSVIGYNIARFLAPNARLLRMKFSSLTKEELRKAYKEAHELNSFEIGMTMAGLARHHIDWFWGINLSRALSTSLYRVGVRKILSTGRVQGPTLHILVEKEREIRRFTSSYFYKIFAVWKGFEFSSEEITNIDDALRAFFSAPKEARVVEVKKREAIVEPPPPFNLTDLQTEASRVLGYTPKKTLQIAQKLYESGYISYPRTSSQKLPKDLDTDAILRKLSFVYPFAKKLLGRKAIEGKKEDPAHPAIYPTGNIPKGISREEQRLYDLIARRFLAAFSDPAKRLYVNIRISLGGLILAGSFKKTTYKGWLSIYPAGLEENNIPEVVKGDILVIDEVVLQRNQKRPPKRYTPASLVKLMEKLNIGTKATRADIIQTLYDRGYITGKSIKVTPLGEKVIDALSKYAPKIIDVEMTRELEEKMEAIQEQKLRKEELIEGVKKELRKILEEMKEKEKDIGRELKDVVASEYGGTCPYCGGTVVYKLEDRKAVCLSCKKVWYLPKDAKMKVTDYYCKKCDLKLIEVKKRGKSKFYLCPEHGIYSERDLKE